jgi:Uma2 family endonuclease
MMTPPTKTKTSSTGTSKKASLALSRAERAPEPKPIEWTHERYHEMSDEGYFEGKRVELIGGEIIEMASLTSSHWECVNLAQAQIRQVFASGYIVTTRLPVKLPHISEPEPDVAVMRGSWRDFADGPPQTALLIVEVSDATLRLDRMIKSSLYAAAGIQDYWIVNLRARRLEVHRSPVESAKGKFGWVYQEKVEYKEDETISPLAAPEAEIQVADLLP